MGQSWVEDSLLHRVARGIPEAVSECLEQYGPGVWGLARRYSSTEQDAEDAFQEIFLDVWRSAGSYDPTKAEERTFIFLIARRRLIDRNRARSRRPPTVPLPDDVPSGKYRIDDADRNLAIASLRDAFRELTAEQRRVLRLSLEQGYSHSEISKRLHLPLGTVKSLIRRGLLRTRRMLSTGTVHSPILGDKLQ